LYLDAPYSSRLFTPFKYTNSPNEYFILSFLEAFFRGWNDDFLGLLRLDDNYRDDFINTLSQYKMDISLLNPVSFSERLCFIEKRYFYKSKINSV
jgi:hypothetical protein